MWVKKVRVVKNIRKQVIEVRSDRSDRNIVFSINEGTWRFISKEAVQTRY